MKSMKARSGTGRSSIAHLHENLAAAELALSGELLARLDAIGKSTV